jgi:hypothetical protein
MEPALLSVRNIQESVDDPRKSAEITVQPASSIRRNGATYAAADDMAGSSRREQVQRGLAGSA